MIRPVRKAVFPVAGLGTRFLPATKAMPKEMLCVVDKPIIQYVVDEAREAGIEHFIFVTGRNKQAIEDHFDQAFELERILEDKGKADELEQLRLLRPAPGESSFTRQQEPLGLGHAVWCARDLVGSEPFAVILPDVIVKSSPGCLAQMMAAYGQIGGNIIAVEEVPADQTDKYGIIDPAARDGRLIEMRGMVEKPRPADAPSNLSITGRYILQPEIFATLETQPRGAGGEIQLTDAMASLMQRQPFHAYQYEGDSFDCGDKSGFLRATVAHALDRPDLGPDFIDYLKSLDLGRADRA